MKISLNGVGKRFGRYWVFKDVTQAFDQGNTYAILGHNGSGKSTLLRIIAGMQNASSGKIIFEEENRVIDKANIFRTVSFCAPGMELPEELTLQELLDFHFTFRKPLEGITVKDIISLTGLSASAHKQIGDYSSGMRQRVKLAQAIFSDTAIILLDEPCTNLDEEGVTQYLGWIKQYTEDRTVVVASNDKREYEFCKERISLAAFA